jgi:hypothetical protein
MQPDVLARLKEELLRCEKLPIQEREARLAEIRSTDPELERDLRGLLEQNPIDGGERGARVLD